MSLTRSVYRAAVRDAHKVVLKQALAARERHAARKDKFIGGGLDEWWNYHRWWLERAEYIQHVIDIAKSGQARRRGG